MVEKIAFDPGWGHYEVLALQRWFADDVTQPGAVRRGAIVQLVAELTIGLGRRRQCAAAGGAEVPRSAGQRHDRSGHRPLWHSQLPDVQVGPTGTLQSLHATHFLVGAVGHPFAGNDFYAYYGQEQNSANAWTNGATQGGLGNVAYTQ